MLWYKNQKWIYLRWEGEWIFLGLRRWMNIGNGFGYQNWKII